ncbi:hypothetical protein MBLNU457_7744t1 [Dothideomycetes sp. NU457]
MECDICSHELDQKRQPVCPSCARAAIYESRIQQIHGLLEKEQLHKRINTVVQGASVSDIVPQSPDAQSVDLAESSKKLQISRWQTQTATIDQRIADIKEQQAILREQIKDAKADKERRRQEHRLRHSEIRKAASDLKSRKPQMVDPLQSEIKRLHHKLGKVNNRMVEGRTQLCRETANIAGLSLRKRKTTDGKYREDYIIGGIHIPNLRELNMARPEYVSATFTNISRLLMTCCHYLSIRPPSEIVCQQAGMAYPAMLSLQSSYQTVDGTSTSMAQSTIGGMASSRILTGRSARPKLRPLHLEKPLPLLAKEDPATYNLFIEGATLLAWNVAWLCKTQGMTGIDSWEDVCSIGKNLWQLFGINSDTKDKIVTNKEPPAPRFGEYSHATSYKSLSNPTMADHMRASSLPPLASISDRLKSHLLTEMSGAEWELLDEREWNDDQDDEQAVLVGSDRRAMESKMGVSFMTAVGDPDESNREEGKGKSSSGWTKLKSRTSEGGNE